MVSVWYLDFGASFHMIGFKEFYNSLKEKDLHVNIEMGDDREHNATGIGIITFERDKASPLHLKDGMFVPELKKNLIFVAVLEDHGYDVIFSKWKSFLRHIATRKVKQIEVQVKNLYKLKVGDCNVLRSKAEKVSSHDVGEL